MQATIEVRVRPRAQRNEIAGERDGAILVRVSAPPHEGRANEAVRKLIASAAGIPRSRVSIVRGTRGRDKLVRAEGIAEPELRRRLLAG